MTDEYKKQYDHACNLYDKTLSCIIDAYIYNKRNKFYLGDTIEKDKVLLHNLLETYFKTAFEETEFKLLIETREKELK